MWALVRNINHFLILQPYKTCKRLLENNLYGLICLIWLHKKSYQLFSNRQFYQLSRVLHIVLGKHVFSVAIHRTNIYKQ